MKDAIRNARIEKDMSQSELAESMGVSQATVSYWESGASVPATRTIPKLADTLGIPIENLFEDRADGQTTQRI